MLDVCVDMASGKWEARGESDEIARGTSIASLRWFLEYLDLSQHEAVQSIRLTCEKERRCISISCVQKHHCTPSVRADI